MHTHFSPLLLTRGRAFHPPSLPPSRSLNTSPPRDHCALSPHYQLIDRPPLLFLLCPRRERPSIASLFICEQQRRARAAIAPRIKSPRRKCRRRRRSCGAGWARRGCVEETLGFAADKQPKYKQKQYSSIKTQRGDAVNSQPRLFAHDQTSNSCHSSAASPHH